MTEDFREDAEKHWKFIEKLLRTYGLEASEETHWLYVEAMVHGYKHGMKGKV